MDYVIMFLIFTTITSVMVWIIYDRYLQWEQKKQLGFMREMPDYEDCLEANRQLMVFLHDRYWNINTVDSCSKAGMDGNYLTLIDSHDIVDLIRYIHLCGCRITIEEVADHDVESPNSTPEALKKFHSDLDRARDERINRKYRR
jgi:hypothetical protein